MTGTSSDVAFADAYVKGVKLPDPLGAYDAALKNATVLPTSSAVGRKGLDTSIFLSALFAGVLAVFTQTAVVTAFVDRPGASPLEIAIVGVYQAMANGQNLAVSITANA